MYNLPEYEPSDEVWNKINTELNNDILRKGISELPDYEPDGRIWENIEAELNPKIVKLKPWRWVAVAASIVLVIGLGFYLNYQKNQPVIAYSEQKMDAQLLLQSSDNSDADYETIVAFCKEQTYVCENPEFKSLKVELDDLQAASTQLKEAMGEYNTEPALVNQLAQIELQKSEILKKMTTKI